MSTRKANMNFRLSSRDAISGAVNPGTRQHGTTTPDVALPLTRHPLVLDPAVDPVALASMAGKTGGGGKPNGIYRRGRSRRRKLQEQAGTTAILSAGAIMRQ